MRAHLAHVGDPLTQTFLELELGYRMPLRALMVYETRTEKIARNQASTCKEGRGARGQRRRKGFSACRWKDFPAVSRGKPKYIKVCSHEAWSPV